MDQFCKKYLRNLCTYMIFCNKVIYLDSNFKKCENLLSTSQINFYGFIQIIFTINIHISIYIPAGNIFIIKTNK